jgi:hypothetical protein
MRSYTWGLAVVTVAVTSLFVGAEEPAEVAPPAGLQPVHPVVADCVSECGPQGEVIGGAGISLLQPFFSNNPAITFFRQGTGPGRREDIRHQMSAAPLVWLGYRDDSGLGVRGRWWYFREGTDQNYQLPPPQGRTLTVLSAAPMGAFIIRDNPRAFAVTSKLQLQVADVEVFQDATLCNWNFLLSGGLGYADITQNYNAYAIGRGGVRSKPLISGSSYVGFGPEFAVEARRPLSDTGLNLYGSARTRLLFGNATQNAFGGDELRGSQENRQHAVVAVEELELGLEYGRTVGQSRFVGQVALVGQEWFGAGNATRSNRVSAPTTIPIFSGEDTSTFGFLGVSFRVGVTY